MARTGNQWTARYRLLHRVRGLAACFLAMGLMLTAIACGPRARPPAPVREPPIPPGLPVVELPAVDFARGGPRALEQKSPPPALGAVIALTKFVVRVEAAIPTDMKGTPTRGVLFYVYQRTSSGRLAAGASCPLTPTATDRKGVVIYQGVCPGTPMRRGDAIIEVNYRDKSYLVRSAQVQ
jgi:hypothetical protein